ncbi:MAG: uracil-DNA glycosylase [Opitutae bacterium]|nr:uracil-DNA glycosylase [Opitutae bacterium]
MTTRTHLLALNDELRRLKAGGQRTVSVTEEGLAQLREAVTAVRAETEAAIAPVAVAALGVAETPRPVTARSVATVAGVPVAPAAPEIKLPEGDKQARWDFLRDRVLNDSVCRARVCPGKRVVFGVGNLDAAIMFVGEAPGGDEEEQGEPFVGRAGQLLNKMIKAMGLERGQVYIGNILNWRPEMGARNPDGSQTGNRPPTAEEMAYCLPFIRAQIAIIQPRVLVALGKTAVDGLLGPEQFKSMGAARGAWHSYAATPLRATYHPSYLLRQEGLVSAGARKIKRDAWEDMLAVMERAGLPISEKQKNYFR